MNDNTDTIVLGVGGMIAAMLLYWFVTEPPNRTQAIRPRRRRR